MRKALSPAPSTGASANSSSPRAARCFSTKSAIFPSIFKPSCCACLQDHEYSRFGGRDILKADVRILAATNQDLEKAVKEKRFREDLYFRLKVIPIYLPPLRERRGDIPLLIGYFIDKINREMGIQISGVSPEAQRLLEAHAWPGNVREMENTLIRAAVFSSGPILFPKDFTLQNKPATTLEVDQLSLEEIIRHKLEDYFRRTEGVDVDNLYSL